VEFGFVLTLKTKQLITAQFVRAARFDESVPAAWFEI
jgi:hypothetical protein